jgi:hypothetical protein
MRTLGAVQKNGIHKYDVHLLYNIKNNVDSMCHPQMLHFYNLTQVAQFVEVPANTLKRYVDQDIEACKHLMTKKTYEKLKPYRIETHRLNVGDLFSLGRYEEAKQLMRTQPNWCIRSDGE